MRKNNRKKAINSLANDLDKYRKTDTEQRVNAVQSLVECYLNTSESKRQKAIQQIIARSEGVRQLIADNPELVRADVEQALIRAATGYTVTERRERIVGGRKTVEIITRDVPPNQSAVEFFLTNKAGDTYSKAPVAMSEDGAGKLDAILEAMKNVK